MQAPTQGKINYDMLIKSMIARLEFNNSLAPIQDYGRHQTKQALKKKKTKKPNVNVDHPSTVSNEPNAHRFDDNYYDLDDDFIDDDDVEG